MQLYVWRHTTASGSSNCAAALPSRRLQCNVVRQEELKLKTPWREDAMHLVTSPLELIQRLATLLLPQGQHENA
ncbi:MAG TPA: hypothetical protein VFF81_09035 [Noviherbaspirillum sp.]|nr:hypothetical protein [Noviherbaspirillum sp.]